MLSIWSPVLLVAAVVVAADEIVRYDGHKLVSVQAVNEKQLKFLHRLHDETEHDFWTHPSLIRPTDIRVKPTEFDQLFKDLVAYGFNVTILQEDIQKLIEDLGQHPHSKRQVRLEAHLATDGFPSYTTFYSWASRKAADNSNIMSLRSIGKTYEGRDTHLIVLGVPGSNKPVVWIDSGIHAREWLAVSTSINMIDMMITGYLGKDQAITELLQKFDWYFLPVANPDGYEYSHTAGGRLWRKTRTVYRYSIGADANRNFGYQWGTTGSSMVETSDQFCGPAPWSEKETMNIKTTLEGLQSRLKVFITIHSYGQMWFVPYAWSRVAYPPDYSKLVSVANRAVAALARVSGARYSVGRVPDLLYEASGSSMDWVKGVLNTPYSYGMELRPTFNTQNGFITSTANIKPTAREIWEAVKVVAQQAALEF